MKKSSKILGSIALSAALMMGTAAPAFALTANVPGDTTGGVFTDIDQDTNSLSLANSDEGGASTVVTVSTYTSQLNVTVPLYLPIWLDTAGGTPIVPSNYQYYILNNSPVGVKIDRAVYKNMGNANIKFASSTNETLAEDEFWIKLTPTGEKTVFALDQSDANTSTTGYPVSFTDWKLAARGNTDAKLDLAVTAKSGRISHQIDDAKLASITYTVKVDAGGIDPNNGDGKNETVTETDTTYPTGEATFANTLTVTTSGDFKAFFPGVSNINFTATNGKSGVVNKINSYVIYYKDGDTDKMLSIDSTSAGTAAKITVKPSAISKIEVSCERADNVVVD